MTPLGGDARKLVSGFLQTSPQAPSPWLILLWVFFDVINPECDYRPSPVSPSETLNLEMVWGTLTHRAVITSYKSTQMPFNFHKSVAEGGKKHKKQTWMSRIGAGS